jgi:hypothetical protein
MLFGKGDSMALPRKGRRAITVDSIEYHYMVTFQRSERAVIQLATGTGPCLFVFPFAILKPSHVADAIRFAITRGWSPAKDGEADCWLAFDVDAEDQSYFEHIPNDDFRVVSYPFKGQVPSHLDATQFTDTRPWYNRPRPSVAQN